jgi:hypothetical protein
MSFEDMRLADFTIDDGLPNKCRQLSIGHERVRSQGNEIIQRLDAWTQESLEQAEHRGHRHGTRAVWNDDEDALRADW